MAVRASASASSRLFGKSLLMTGGSRKIRVAESNAIRAKIGVLVPKNERMSGAHVELKFPKAL